MVAGILYFLDINVCVCILCFRSGSILERKTYIYSSPEEKENDVCADVNVFCLLI